MSTQLTLVVQLVSRPEKIEDIKTLLLLMVERSRPEEGCVNYHLHQSNDDPAHFWFYENWTSVDTLNRHLEKPHVKELYARKDELLAGPVDIHYMTMISKSE